MGIKALPGIWSTVGAAGLSYMARRYGRRTAPKSSGRIRSRRLRRRPVSRVAIRKRRFVSRKRRNTYDGTQSHRELGQVSVRFGKRSRKTLKNLYKTVKASEEKTYISSQQLNDFGGVSGAQFFNNVGNDGTAQTCANIRLFSVTGNVNVNPDGAIAAGSVMWFPSFTNDLDSAVVNFTPVDLFNVVGAPATNTSFVTYPLGVSTLRWYRLKLMLYNALNFPGKYRIELIQLKDERLHPDAPATTFRTAFWQAITKQWTFNPCAEADTKVSRYYKVLKRLSIHMDSKDTDQTTSTNYKEVNFFCRLNRTCRYDYNQDDRMNMRNNDQQINNSDNFTDVHPRARLYVLVRALSRRVANNVGFDPNFNPSFDYSVKICHSKLE